MCQENNPVAGQREPGGAEPARRDAAGHAAGSGRRRRRGRRRRLGGRASLGESARARGGQGPTQLPTPALLRQGMAPAAVAAAAHRRAALSETLLQKLRWWCAVGVPFVAFYLTGLALELTAPWYAKTALLFALGAALHALTTALLDDDLKNIFPLSVYLATKVACYAVSTDERKGLYTRGIAPYAHRIYNPRHEAGRSQRVATSQRHTD